MEWKKVYGSSNVQAIAYDEKAKICYVQFLNGGAIYAYENVSAQIWEELQHSESKGRYVQIVLRRAHPFTRVDNQLPAAGSAGEQERRE